MTGQGLLHLDGYAMRWGIRAIVGSSSGEIFVNGTWDSTAVLSEAGNAIEAAAKLAYIGRAAVHWSSAACEAFVR